MEVRRVDGRLAGDLRPIVVAGERHSDEDGRMTRHRALPRRRRGSSTLTFENQHARLSPPFGGVRVQDHPGDSLNSSRQTRTLSTMSGERAWHHPSHTRGGRQVRADRHGLARSACAIGAHPVTDAQFTWGGHPVPRSPTCAGTLTRRSVAGDRRAGGQERRRDATDRHVLRHRSVRQCDIANRGGLSRGHVRCARPQSITRVIPGPRGPNPATVRHAGLVCPPPGNTCGSCFPGRAARSYHSSETGDAGWAVCPARPMPATAGFIEQHRGERRRCLSP